MFMVCKVVSHQGIFLQLLIGTLFNGGHRIKESVRNCVSLVGFISNSQFVSMTWSRSATRFYEAEHKARILLQDVKQLPVSVKAVLYAAAPYSVFVLKFSSFIMSGMMSVKLTAETLLGSVKFE